MECALAFVPFLFLFLRCFHPVAVSSPSLIHSYKDTLQPCIALLSFFDTQHCIALLSVFDTQQRRTSSYPLFLAEELIPVNVAPQHFRIHTSWRRQGFPSPVLAPGVEYQVTGYFTAQSGYSFYTTTENSCGKAVTGTVTLGVKTPTIYTPVAVCSPDQLCITVDKGLDGMAAGAQDRRTASCFTCQDVLR